jgi:hypothetical protein
MIIFGKDLLAPKGSGLAQRNFDMLEFVGHEGYFRNTTVLGSITGEALDLGIIDDPIKSRAEASSENARDKAWNWLTDDVFSRFADKAALLLIGTRWHIDDPAGRMIEHFGDRVQIARFPALAEHDEVHRKMGEPLFPELKSLDFLLERKKLYTSGSWEALYQQNPIITGGGVFPIERHRCKVAMSRSWPAVGCVIFFPKWKLGPIDPLVSSLHFAPDFGQGIAVFQIAGDFVLRTFGAADARSVSKIVQSLVTRLDPRKTEFGG